jgi:predicted dehydrogenase
MSNSEHPIRVGIAGLGRSGWNIHANALQHLESLYRIVAVSDRLAERRQEAEEKFECRAYAEFDELIADDDVELVIVATPNRFHTDHAIQAMRAGRHVMCEKPMALDSAAADAMISAAAETGRVLAPFQNKRYAEDYVKIREVIDSGTLGRIVMIRLAAQGFARRWDWQTLKEHHGGSLNNTAPHLLDLACEFLGDADPEMFCHLENVLSSGDADDHCKVVLRAPGGLVVDVEITSACAYPQDLWLIMGDRGGLRGTPMKLTWKHIPDFESLPDRPVDTNPTDGRTYNQEELPWVEENWELPPSDLPFGPESAYGRFYHDLYKTLRDGAPLVITPQSVRRYVALLERCHELCPL